MNLLERALERLDDSADTDEKPKKKLVPKPGPLPIGTSVDADEVLNKNDDDGD